MEENDLNPMPPATSSPMRHCEGNGSHIAENEAPMAFRDSVNNVGTMHGNTSTGVSCPMEKNDPSPMPPATSSPMQHNEGNRFHIAENEAPVAIRGFLNNVGTMHGNTNTGVNCPMEKIDPNPMPPATSSPMQHNEGNRFHIAENAAPVAIRDFLNNVGTMHTNTTVDHMPIPYMRPAIYLHPRGNVTSTFQSYGHGVTINSDDVISGATQFNSFHRPQFDRNSININSNTNTEFQTNSQVGPAIGTVIWPIAHNFNENHRPLIGGNMPVVYQMPDHGQTVLGDNFMTDSVQSDNIYSSEDIGDIVEEGSTATGMNVRLDTLYSNDMHSPQIQRNVATTTGTNVRPNALYFNDMHSPQIQRNVATATGTNVRPNALYFNDMLSQQIQRNVATATGTNVRPNALYFNDMLIQQIQRNVATETGTNVRPNAFYFSGMHSPQLQRNVASHGGTTPVAFQLQNCGDSNIGENVFANAVQSDNLFFPGQIDSRFLSTRIGGNTAAGFQSNVQARGFSNNNPGALANQLNIFHQPRVDDNRINLGQNMSNWACPNNDGRFINARTNLSPYNIFQTPQSNAQHYLSMPHGRIGLHGYSGVVSRPTNNIQGGSLNNDQALLSRVVPTSAIFTRSTNELNSLQPRQGFLGTVRSLPSESMDSRDVRVRRTMSEQHQSGQLVAANKGSVAQAAKAVFGLADQREWIQRASKGIPFHSHQVKPVSVAETSVHAQTSKTRRPVVRNAIQPTAASPQVWGWKTKSQASIGPSTLSMDQTEPVHHIRWKGPNEPDQLVGVNCAICKRNLRYSATGPVSLPPAPPDVAILPCGHTFHDECLQLITPKEQLTDPPCIPCAIHDN